MRSSSVTLCVDVSAIQILVVDDDHHLVRLIQSYLEQAGYRVVTAYDMATARLLIQTERPALVVLDLMLPDGDGLDLLRQVRSDSHLARLPIIVLTARVDDIDRVLGLEMGADDYISKPFHPREVIARIRAVLRRTSAEYTAPVVPVLGIGDLVLDADRHTVTRAGHLLDLTPTEFNLLHAFLRQPGHAFTRLELVEQGLGLTSEALERVIDSHIKNLRRKIEPDPAHPTYIKTVYGVGYKLVVPE
ncbi:MAG: response regulator transcription factor [Chloroflexaceae bacterium]|nr:response regulator transcription factor [Chloroflexaceae bacterium]